MNRIVKSKLQKPKRRRIRPAAGIRRKIRYGFMILGALLLFSGLISVFELSRLSRTTGELLGISVRDLELSTKMFEAVEQQNEALLFKASAMQVDSLLADSLFRAGQADFDRAFREVEQRDLYPARLARIASSRQQYEQVLRNTPVGTGPEYRLAYYRLALDIKDFMIDSQNTVDHNTTTVRANAYRALMPGIITLGIAILIIFVFYVMIDFYYIRPVLKVKRALSNYLEGKIPYNVPIEGRDEVKELSDDIATLVTLHRKKESNG